MAYAHLFSSSQTGKVDWPSSIHISDGKILQFAIFLLARFIFVSYSLAALVRPLKLLLY
jgi:hypothetical protein